MNIIVLSKRLAKDFISDAPWAAISIDTIDKWPSLGQCQRVDLLRLSFADLDKQEYIDTHNELFSGYKIRLFTEQDAEDILNFILSVKDRIDTLLVHCEAGISRSPAIAGALSLIFYQNDEKFFKKPYSPNMVVYRTILNKANEKGLISI
jgi:predicted protein tyrosine phosphatase